jgi:hypothetical protein
VPLLDITFNMKVSFAIFGALAIANAAPKAEIKVIEQRTSIPDIFGSRQLSGAFVDLLEDVAAIVQRFKGQKGTKPIPSKNSFKDWKTFKANGVNLGGWLCTYRQHRRMIRD